MKFQAFLFTCLSGLVVLLISLSLFATHAFAFDQSAVEQFKNNSDLPNATIDSVKVPEAVDIPPLSPQKSILPPNERLNSDKITPKTQQENCLERRDFPHENKLQVCPHCDCDNLKNKDNSENCSECCS